MSPDDFGFGTQIRKSPFFESTIKWGAKDFSVYNHMYIPRDFGSPEKNFWNLIETAVLCDVAVERQVQITGKDASKFIQLLTPRNLSNMYIQEINLLPSKHPICCTLHKYYTYRPTVPHMLVE